MMGGAGKKISGVIGPRTVSEGLHSIRKVRASTKQSAPIFMERQLNSPPLHGLFHSKLGPLSELREWLSKRPSRTVLGDARPWGRVWRELLGPFPSQSGASQSIPAFTACATSGDSRRSPRLALPIPPRFALW